MIWIVILLVAFVGLIFSIAYLVSRASKLTIVKKLSGDKKWVRRGIGLLGVIVLGAILCIAMNMVNMVICILYFVIFLAICDFVFFIIQKKRKTEFKYYYAGIIAIILTVAYFSYGWYTAHHVIETDYVINTNKEIGDDKIRAVVWADSHVGTTFHGEGFATHMKEIEEVEPDVVLIAGDFVDDDTTKEDMISCCKALGKLKTKYGVYYCFGNHDKGYYGNERRGYSGADLINELQKNNVTVLQDEATLVHEKFYIIGRQDASEPDRMSMDDLVKELDKSKFMIVMDHQPYDYDAEEESKVDLVVSGHTHGGQLFPFNKVGEWSGANAKVYGHEKRSNTNFVVTSGISDWSIKFKTGCVSEFAVIDIK